MVIDGILDEPSWLNAETASGFIQEDPAPGQAPAQPTNVWVLYDDQAIYIGARMHDEMPHLIARELSERNVIGNTDYFEVVIDPYRDGINGYSFVLTASGVQRDARIYNNNRDAAWDTVWESAVSIDSAGWSVEMRIPFAAIRFPKSTLQHWNINFGRNIRRYREQSWWNEIDPALTGFLAQSGVLKNLRDLKPPLRLSLYPFLALSKEYNGYTGQNPWGLSGGMDLKLGIGQAFTLDMTLIPDFSQTQTDRDYLNLSPFELVFDENRPFFTEGMELFNRGNLFYSRRIGGRPGYYIPITDELEAGDEVVFFPQSAQLINATKLSGRTNFGLGLGFFNAISAKENALIVSDNGEERYIPVVPMTNFNMVVADQSLKNNSNIALSNTNVSRTGKAPSSNVSGADFQLFNAGRMFALKGFGHYSLKNQTDVSPETGYQYQLEFGKVSGNFRGAIRYRSISDSFDPNDMGLLQINNEKSVSGSLGYFLYEPTGPFNRFNNQVHFRRAQLFTGSDLTGLRFDWDATTYFKNWDFLRVAINVHPIAVKDFFEPRTNDFSSYYLMPARAYGNFYFSTDYRRKLAIDLRLEGTTFDEDDRYIYAWTIEPRVRFSDRFSMIATTRWIAFNNDKGFVRPKSAAIGYENIEAGDIIFGSRNRSSIENSLELKYIFTNRMNASLRGRHFYSLVEYRDFFKLKADGTLTNSGYTGKTEDAPLTLHDLAFHIFTIDLIYTWRFAPGSDLIFVWKNNIFSGRNEVPDNYFRELGNLLTGPQENALVVKAIYYLDYHRYFGSGSSKKAQ